MGPDKTIYDRDYVIDYTSPERNDLAEFNLGHYQWQGDKKVHDLTHLYNAAGQRLQTESTRYVDWAGEKHYTRYIHEDIMGSSYYYTNPENGYGTNKHEYTTWGNNTKAPTYNYDPEYRASEPYFTGHPYDGSLNLYYAENRFYDPETGSFLSSDPAKSGLNWYQYCGSNPTTYVDPLGLEPLGMDTFFFNKMEDSGVPMDAFAELEKVAGIDEIKDNIYAYTEKVLTAKYLTIFLLNDAYFSHMGKEWISGVIANVFIEGYPGLYELPGNAQNYIYMEQAIKNGYGNIYNNETGFQPNKIEDIRKFINDGNIFGIGMFQWTYPSRALGLLQKYEDVYGLEEENLTFEEKFLVEYMYMKDELMREHAQKNSENIYVPNYETGTSAAENGASYRDIVVNNPNSHVKAGNYAEAWKKELEERKIW